uniref:Uncharacterized protein n=1 Tax=Chromera velia CCMP2878 TaxID=1169474 RepID=A0A0G4I5Q4_9ALVE|eukprot:Cvel_1858.t1-p1 / transcript=Cvel_1858.t1 / gene=Cvel_1858 / organism=Chromera_velia_CCMP2878 / gene_product=hypothetical protein / transcript_product=hypothetical protein / location=Cvel_scaffold69:10026-16046(+) / protein_length=1429 / sequence_SO=supercontig / SO=protein_coding / is_pseudo=false
MDQDGVVDGCIPVNQPLTLEKRDSDPIDSSLKRIPLDGAEDPSCQLLSRSGTCEAGSTRAESSRRDSVASRQQGNTNSSFSSEGADCWGTAVGSPYTLYPPPRQKSQSIFTLPPKSPSSVINPKSPTSSEPSFSPSTPTYQAPHTREEEGPSISWLPPTAPLSEKGERGSSSSSKGERVGEKDKEKERPFPSFDVSANSSSVPPASRLSLSKSFDDSPTVTAASLTPSTSPGLCLPIESRAASWKIHPAPAVQGEKERGGLSLIDGERGTSADLSTRDVSAVTNAHTGTSSFSGPLARPPRLCLEFESSSIGDTKGETKSPPFLPLEPRGARAMTSASTHAPSAVVSATHQARHSMPLHEGDTPSPPLSPEHMPGHWGGDSKAVEGEKENDTECKGPTVALPLGALGGGEAKPGPLLPLGLALPGVEARGAFCASATNFRDKFNRPLIEDSHESRHGQRRTTIRFKDEESDCRDGLAVVFEYDKEPEWHWTQFVEREKEKEAGGGCGGGGGERELEKEKEEEAQITAHEMQARLDARSSLSQWDCSSFGGGPGGGLEEEDKEADHNVTSNRSSVSLFGKDIFFASCENEFEDSDEEDDVDSEEYKVLRRNTHLNALPASFLDEEGLQGEPAGAVSCSHLVGRHQSYSAPGGGAEVPSQPAFPPCLPSLSLPVPSRAATTTAASAAAAQQAIPGQERASKPPPLRLDLSEGEQDHQPSQQIQTPFPASSAAPPGGTPHPGRRISLKQPLLLPLISKQHPNTPQQPLTTFAFSREDLGTASGQISNSEKSPSSRHSRGSSSPSKSPQLEPHNSHVSNTSSHPTTVVDGQSTSPVGEATTVFFDAAAQLPNDHQIRQGASTASAVSPSATERGPDQFPRVRRDTSEGSLLTAVAAPTAPVSGSKPGGSAGMAGGAGGVPLSRGGGAEGNDQASEGTSQRSAAEGGSAGGSTARLWTVPRGETELVSRESTTSITQVAVPVSARTDVEGDPGRPPPQPTEEAAAVTAGHSLFRNAGEEGCDAPVHPQSSLASSQATAPLSSCSLSQTTPAAVAATAATNPPSTAPAVGGGKERRGSNLSACDPSFYHPSHFLKERAHNHSGPLSVLSPASGGLFSPDSNRWAGNESSPGAGGVQGGEGSESERGSVYVPRVGAGKGGRASMTFSTSRSVSDTSLHPATVGAAAAAVAAAIVSPGRQPRSPLPNLPSSFALPSHLRQKIRAHRVASISHESQVHPRRWSGRGSLSVGKGTGLDPEVPVRCSSLRTSLETKVNAQKPPVSPRPSHRQQLLSGGSSRPSPLSSLTGQGLEEGRGGGVYVDAAGREKGEEKEKEREKGVLAGTPMSKSSTLTPGRQGTNSGETDLGGACVEREMGESLGERGGRDLKLLQPLGGGGKEICAEISTTAAAAADEGGRERERTANDASLELFFPLPENE